MSCQTLQRSSMLDQLVVSFVGACGFKYTWSQDDPFSEERRRFS